MKHYKRKYTQGTATPKKRKSGTLVWVLSINEKVEAEVVDETGKPVILENGTVKTSTKSRTLRKRSKVPCSKTKTGYTNKRKAEAELAEWRETLLKRAEEDYQNAIRCEEEKAQAQKFSYDNMTVPTFLENYFTELEDDGRELSTIDGYRTSTACIRRHFEGKKLGELTEDDLKGFDRTFRKSGLSDTSRNKALRVLKQAIKVHHKQISTNPFEDFKMPSPNNPDPNPLTRSSLARLKEQLAEAEPNQFNTAVEMALRTGMRQGEICGLRWRDVDLSSGTIHVVNAIGRFGGNCKFYEKGPKTNPRRRKSADRTIDGSPKIRAMFLKRLEHMVSEYVAEHVTCTREDAKKAVLSTMYVCGRVDGSFYNPTVLGRTWRGYAQTLMGITGKRPVFHDLRHTYASYALDAGINVVVVSKTLGHADPSITWRMYAGLLDGSGKAAQDLMDSIF